MLSKLSATATAIAQYCSAARTRFNQCAEFTDFTLEDDPHGEHDFLSFEHCHRTFFWKCDYYNKETDSGSKDPADPDKTTRVGTLMLAEEY